MSAVLRERLDPATYLPAMTEELASDVLALAEDIATSLYMHSKVSGQRPSALAGASLYLAELAINAPNHTHQTVIAELTGTSDTSIRTHMSLVAQLALDANVTDRHPPANNDVLRRIASGEPADLIVASL